MTESKIVDGYWLEHADERGVLTAQIYRPTPGRKHWALCFSCCSGRYLEKQGKYEAHATKCDAVESLNNTCAS